jgi:hypothetical protein
LADRDAALSKPTAKRYLERAVIRYELKMYEPAIDACNQAMRYESVNGLGPDWVESKAASGKMAQRRATPDRIAADDGKRGSGLLAACRTRLRTTHVGRGFYRRNKIATTF